MKSNRRRKNGKAPGRKCWAVPEGYIPAWSHGRKPEMTSHGALCILNAGNRSAEIEITIFHHDREPTGPYRLQVAARRTRHVRLNDLKDPEPIPRGVEFSSFIRASEPVVVQYTRLDSRQAENALLSSMAFPVD